MGNQICLKHAEQKKKKKKKKKKKNKTKALWKVAKGWCQGTIGS